MVKFLKSDATFSQDLTAGALSFTTSYDKPFKLEQITLKATVNITETVTITVDSANGATYDVVLRKVNLSAEQDVVFRPEGEANFKKGDEIKVQCTNANTTGTVNGAVKTSELN